MESDESRDERRRPSGDEALRRRILRPGQPSMIGKV